MARDLTAGMVTEFTAGTLNPRLLAYFDFPSGAVRVWNGSGNLSWNTYTWSGIGTFGTFKPAQGGTDISAQGAEFGLSGIPSSLISTALDEAYQNRDCELWLACLDSGGSVVSTPYKWAGRMDVMTIEEKGETSDIRITAESRLIDLDKPRVRRYTNEDQQQEYSGDLGLEFVTAIADIPIHWGAKNQERTIPKRPTPPKSAV
jgi:hypothetical protein